MKVFAILSICLVLAFAREQQGLPIDPTTWQDTITKVTTQFLQPIPPPTVDPLQLIEGFARNLSSMSYSEVEAYLKNATSEVNRTRDDFIAEGMKFEELQRSYVVERSDLDVELNLYVSLAVDYQNDTGTVCLIVGKVLEKRNLTLIHDYNFTISGIKYELSQLDVEISQTKYDIFQNRLNAQNATLNSTRSELDAKYQILCKNLSDYYTDQITKHNLIQSIQTEMETTNGYVQQSVTVTDTKLTSLTQTTYKSMEYVESDIDSHPEYVEELSSDLVALHERIHNSTVVIRKNDPNDPSAGFTIVFSCEVDHDNETAEETAATENEISALVRGCVVYHLQVSTENVEVFQSIILKRDVTETWNAVVTQATTVQNVSVIWNHTNFEVPPIDPVTMQEVQNFANQSYEVWQALVQTYTPAQLLAYYSQAQSLVNAYPDERNVSVFDFDMSTKNFSDYLHGDYIVNLQNVRLIVTSDTGSEEDITRIILNFKLQNETNAKTAAYLVKQQYDIQCNDALNTQHSAELSYMQVLISLLTDPQNITLLVKKSTLEQILQNAYIQFAVCNHSRYFAELQYNNISQDMDQLDKEVQDQTDTVVSKKWKSIATLKADWQADKDTIRLRFKDYIETFLDNTTVISDDFNDIDNNANGDSLTLNWNLDVTPDNGETLSTKLEKVKNVVVNILCSEAGEPKSSITVTLQVVAKRSNQVTAFATVSNPGSSGSNSASNNNTPYVIGGVVAGVVLLAIIIVIVLLVVFKKNDDRV